MFESESAQEYHTRRRERLDHRKINAWKRDNAEETRPVKSTDESSHGGLGPVPLQHCKHDGLRDGGTDNGSSVGDLQILLEAEAKGFQIGEDETMMVTHSGREVTKYQKRKLITGEASFCTKCDKVHSHRLETCQDCSKKKCGSCGSMFVVGAGNTCNVCMKRRARMS